MAVSSGDSFAKLPPIKTDESLTEDMDEFKSASKQRQASHLRGLNRKRHGLVRLPPIVRLDSWQTPVNKSPGEETEEVSFLGQFERQNDEDVEQTNSFSLDTEGKQQFAYSRFNNDIDFEEKDSGHENWSSEAANAVNRYTEVEASETNLNFSLGQRKRSPFPKLNMKNNNVPYDRLHNTPREKNKVNEATVGTNVKAFTASPKVQRTNRFAKSTPLLRRNNAKAPVKESKSFAASNFRQLDLTKSSTEKTMLQAGAKKSSVSVSESQNLLEKSENATYFEKLSNVSVIKTDKDNRHQRNGQRIFSDAKSTPTSPLSSRGNTKDNQSRRSLDSATELLATPRNKRISLRPPTIQNLQSQPLQNCNELCVEGRRFAPTERVPVNCSHSVNNLETESTRNSLNLSQLPSFSEKRTSVYDLQQILSLLNAEDSLTSSEDYNGSISNARNSRASSTYDLKEFLLLRSPVKNPEVSASSLKNSTSSLRTTNNFLSVETFTGVKENEESRRPSAYDLLEFLQLSNPGLNENVNQPANKQAILEQYETGRKTVPLLGNLEGAGQNSDFEARRSSMYNLAEFLSLNIPMEKRKVESNIANSTRENISAKKSMETMTKLLSPETENPKTTRSKSLYDLMEFLKMSSLGAHSGTSKDGTDRKNSNSATKALPNDTSDKRCYSSEKKLQATNPKISNHSHKNDKKQKTLAKVKSKDSNKLDVSDIQQAREERAASLYDLKEFLVLNTAAITQSEKNSLQAAPENSTGRTNEKKSHLLTPEVLPDNAMAKRDSVYNLHEFLQILQDEDEKSQDKVKNVNTRSASTSPVETINDRTDSRNSSGYSTASTDSPTHVTRKSAQEHAQTQQPSLPQVSSDDLVDMIKLTHSSQLALGRKSSSISMLSGGGSLDGPDDVFLCVPGTSRKRSSVYDLSEFLNLLNSDDAPLRRRLSSVLSKRQSEESLPVTPEPLSRSDSGGVKSMCDLSEFLALLNKDDSPLRRQLSSASLSPRGSRSGQQTPIQHQDSGELTFYSLDEILTALNEKATKAESENAQNDLTRNEISIPVPNFTHSKNAVQEKKDTGTTRIQLKTRISGSSRKLNSVPEFHEVKASNSKRSSV